MQFERGFNDWLRAQLRARRMSQRQLAQRSGVDHSTISRLMTGDRSPSLATATKLARALREPRDGEDVSDLRFFAPSSSHPTARVEYALRSDDQLSPSQVRAVMDCYLRIRKLPAPPPVRPTVRPVHSSQRQLSVQIR